ncbi:MAG: amino acid permease [Alphaproteobacteria bacterium]
MSDLTKSLSLVRGTGLMLNIVIGAGLLVLPGLVVESVGAHAFWSWVVCALVAVPLLLVFIMMGRRFPHAGGVAHFSEMAFGRVGYIVVSLILLGAVIFGLPAIALTGGYYLAEIFPGHATLYAGGLIVFASVAHLISAEVAGRISTFVASVVFLTLLILTATGFSAIEWSTVGGNFVPVSEIDTGVLFLPFMVIFFAFTGWEVAAGTSEEFRNPERDFPRAMVISFIIACLVYFAMAFVVQNVPVSGSYEAAFVSIVGGVFGVAGRLGIALLAGVIIFANLMGAIWAVSRLVFSLSREGYLLFELRANKKGSPVSSVILTSFFLLFVLLLDWFGFLNINQMLFLAGQNFLILYGITSLALLKLSGRVRERFIAAVAMVAVVALLLMQGTSVLYPLCLSILGIAIWYFRFR